MNPTSDLVVVVPGILGSVLKSDAGVHWDLSARSLIALALGPGVHSMLGDSKELVTESLVEDLRLIPGLVKIDGYTGLLAYLRPRIHALGGRMAEFPYDWRQSNAHSAMRLKEFVDEQLDQWRVDCGDSSARLSLVCHSMGGLVAKFYCDVLGGNLVTKNIFTIGTPFRGSVKALSLLCSPRRVGRFNVTEAAKKFQSVYELLPLFPAVRNNDDLVRVRDFLDELPLEADRVLEALDFHDRLSKSAGSASQYSLWTIANRYQRTARSISISRRLEPGLPGIGSVMFEDSGDGTVPYFSAFPIEYLDTLTGGVFAQRHGSMQNSRMVLDYIYDKLHPYMNLHDYRGDTRIELHTQIECPDVVDLNRPFTVSLGSDSVYERCVVIVEDYETGNVAARRVATLGSDLRYEAVFHGLGVGAYRCLVEWPGQNLVVDNAFDYFVVVPHIDPVL